MPNTTVQTIVTDFLKYLPQAEAFFAGQPAIIVIPQEAFEIDGVKIEIATTTITLTK